MKIITKQGMEVNAESPDSLKRMLLHDSFEFPLSNGLFLRVVRVFGGLMYVQRDGDMVFTPFSHNW
jgi:hypothetical protein